MNIHVHVERLVVDDEVSARGGHGIRRGLQQELTRLLHDGGLSHALRDGGAWPSVRGGAIGPQAAREGASFGSAVARAVYDGIGAGK